MTIDYHPYIVRDPAICGGVPVVKGTRITVRTVLASLAEGMRSGSGNLNSAISGNSGYKVGPTAV